MPKNRTKIYLIQGNGQLTQELGQQQPLPTMYNNYIYSEIVINE